MTSARMAKSYAIAAGITLLLTLSYANTVFADSGFRSFNWYAGEGTTLCAIAECPDVAMASNGDTITVAGMGTFTIHPNSVTGGGTFVHKASSGATLAKGTWTATQLVSFVSYGSGSAQGLPSATEGGKAVIRVHATTSTGFEVDALLTVSCLLGSPPAGFDEGIRLNVQDIINFNTPVSGSTLFINTT